MYDTSRWQRCTRRAATRWHIVLPRSQRPLLSEPTERGQMRRQVGQFQVADPVPRWVSSKLPLTQLRRLPRYRLPAIVGLPILRRCSLSPRLKPPPSAPRLSRAASSRPRSSCAGCSRASAITLRRGVGAHHRRVEAAAGAAGRAGGAAVPWQGAAVGKGPLPRRQRPKLRGSRPPVCLSETTPAYPVRRNRP
jgi:hypothetical protein